MTRSRQNPDWHPRLSTSSVTLMYVTGNVSSQGDYRGAWSQRCSCCIRFLLLPVPSQMHLYLFKEKFHLPLSITPNTETEVLIESVSLSLSLSIFPLFISSFSFSLTKQTSSYLNFNSRSEHGAHHQLLQPGKT